VPPFPGPGAAHARAAGPERETRIMNRRFLFAALAAPCLFAPLAVADQAIIPAGKDNTMYQESPAFSNGAGLYMFCGQNAIGGTRRGLIAFDVAGAVPAGSTVTGASLKLHMSRTVAGPVTVSLHRLTSDWGEGTSVGPRDEGGGTFAVAPDATWHYRRFNTDLWTADGGDFVPGPSATQMVDQPDFYIWSDPMLVADVQGWLNNPAQSFGWLIQGDEANPASAKRFDSRQNLDPTFKPQLVVQFTGRCRVDVNHDGQVNVADFLAFLQLYAAGDAAADMNGDGQVNVSDFLAFLAAYAAGCP
jgi:hypothetical protein